MLLSRDSGAIMRISKLIIAAAAVMMSPAGTSAAKSVHSEYMEAWGERHDRYDGEFKTAEAGLKTAGEQFWAAAAANAPDLRARLDALFAATDDLGYRAGRAEMNQSLLQFIANKPSAQRADLWLQDQMDKMRQAQAAAKGQFDQASAIKIGENGETPQSKLTSMGKAIFAGGALRGQTAELTLINDNLATYYQAKTQQDAERRARWRAALGAFGQSMQAQAQAQAQANRSWTAHCTTVGNSTNCMGM